MIQNYNYITKKMNISEILTNKINSIYNFNKEVNKKNKTKLIDNRFI